MARRGLTSDRWLWVVALLPLIGAIGYLVVRPPLTQTDSEVSTQANYNTVP